mmetsp:Transcript_11818/g.21612  ORF Transcript_11818/g.21612 Transcript_11818/m.21612 type:complete len:324 (-) Transcript_11818:2481-3452(-)
MDTRTGFIFLLGVGLVLVVYFLRSSSFWGLDSLDGEWAGREGTSAGPTCGDCVNAQGGHCAYECEYQHARRDVERFCDLEPAQPACFIAKRCAQSKSQLGYCSGFSLLASVCRGNNNSKWCNSYTNLCSGMHATRQCLREQALKLPSTMHATHTVLAICSHMKMSGCERCVSHHQCPDPFPSLVQLCNSMTMEGCETTVTPLCNEPSLYGPLGCPPTESLPEMQMFFHFGISDYILFKSWIPRTLFQYALYCLGIVCSGVLSFYLKGLRHMHRENDHARALFTAIIVVLDYSMMLVAMTYNVGLFVSIVLGFSLGQYLYGRVS